MIGDITNGIAGQASLGERPAAGKTGTSEGFFDSWFVGFTPQMVTGVWMGYAEGGATLEDLLSPEGTQLGTVGSPTRIWQSYMQSILEDEPTKRFKGVDGPQSLIPPSSDDATSSQGAEGSESPSNILDDGVPSASEDIVTESNTRSTPSDPTQPSDVQPASAGQYQQYAPATEPVVTGG